MKTGWSDEDGRWFVRKLPHLRLRNEQIVVECGPFTAVRLGSKDNTLRWRFAWREAEKFCELPVAQVHDTSWWPSIFDFLPKEEQGSLCWCGTIGGRAEKGHVHEAVEPGPRDWEDDLQTLLIACRGFDSGNAFYPAEPDDWDPQVTKEEAS